MLKLGFALHFVQKVLGVVSGPALGQLVVVQIEREALVIVPEREESVSHGTGRKL